MESIYAKTLDEIINSKKNENFGKKNEPKKIGINKPSHEYKKINFNSQKYKNSIVKKQESEKINNPALVKEFLTSDQENVYHRDWNKLENGFKKNRISHYVNKLHKERNMKESQKQRLKDYLYQCIDKKLICRKTDVKYNIDTCEIENIIPLKITDDNHFLTIAPKKKKKVIKKNNSKQTSIIGNLIKQTKSNSIKKENEKNKIKKYLDNNR